MKSESIRQRKLADLIKKELSQIIDRKINDPRKGFITITNVKVSGDLRIASIYFTVLGDDEQIKQSQNALDSAKNFIRSELAPNIKLRYIPEIRFFYDQSFEYSQNIENLLKKIKSDQHEKDDP